MKRLSLVALAVVVLVMCSTHAFAVNEIIFGLRGGNPVQFTGTGSGNFTVNFNLFNAVASGFGSLSSTGYYSVLNGGATINSNGSCGTGCYLLNQSSAINFMYTSLQNGNGTNLLDGSLQLIDITQSGTSGVFNDKLVVNFTPTGGTLDTPSKFPLGTGRLQLTIQFHTTQSLATLLSGHTLSASAISGLLVPTTNGPALPEPASLTLLGGGLLAFAGVCRKKLWG